MATHATAKLIQADRDRSTQAGVESTPTFFIGDRALAGAYPVDTFRVVLDQAIAKAKATKYEVQDEDPGTQMVHVFGDAATVTARIWVKGTRANGTTFDRRVWFTDTYVRTPQGWRYAFAQVAN